MKLVEIKDGQLTTTSRKIAKKFGKRHADVLKAIYNLECSAQFNQRNFTLVKYKDRKGEWRPEYEITRDGFVFVVMGFTGKMAAQFKEDYIEAFNAMAQALRTDSQLFKKILLDYPSVWRKTFPDRFFKGVYDMYGLPFERSKGTASFVGNFINKYIYDHILGGLSIELKKKRELQNSPADKLHQYIEENAKEILKDHISKIELVLQFANDKTSFDALFEKYTQPNQMRLAV